MNLLLIYGQPIIIAKLITPINVALGSQLAINSGIAANNSKGSFPLAKTGLTSNKTGICFPMMISPIAASIPCTADNGKKSMSFPSLNTPKRICTKPATTMAPNAKCQPVSPLPNSATAPATITIKPAAGPLIVKRDPKLWQFLNLGARPIKIR